MSPFDIDPYPGRPKILFIGWPNSPHTHSWVNLLRDTPFNVRMFCFDSGLPPEDWWPRCYTTLRGAPVRDDERRRTVYPLEGVASHADALARVIAEWRPDIVHSLGIDPAAYLYCEVCRTNLELRFPRWIVQARGGSDTALPRYNAQLQQLNEQIFTHCDHFIADNHENYEYAVRSGLAPTKINDPVMGPVPGPGGLDLDAMRARWTLPPSRRQRLIVWPKAYETPWAKAMPVFEGILNAWEQIRPCRIEMLWMEDPHVRMWYMRLFPEEVQRCCNAPPERLTHEETLELFARARVVLAPSLIDGVPNSMMEAMALGAVPIVSPLETITPVVRDGVNVLFARNLYPHEIATVLVQAMSDDALVDRIAENNVVHVRSLADRRAIRRRALDYYEEVARQARVQNQKYSRPKTSLEDRFYFRSNDARQLLQNADPDSTDTVGDRLSMKLDGSGCSWILASGDGPESYRAAVGINAVEDTGFVKNLYFRTGGTTRMVMTNDGRIGIGIASPHYKIQINGKVVATSYAQLADARFQHDTVPIRDALDVIGQLKGVRFRWRVPDHGAFGDDLDLPSDTVQIGFSGEQLEEVLPEAVSRSETGLRHVDVGSIVPILVEAVKAQQRIIEELSARLDRVGGPAD